MSVNHKLRESAITAVMQTMYNAYLKRLEWAFEPWVDEAIEKQFGKTIGEKHYPKSWDELDDKEFQRLEAEAIVDAVFNVINKDSCNVT